MGDLNVTSTVSNDTERNKKGRLIEEILQEMDRVLLINEWMTHCYS